MEEDMKTAELTWGKQQGDYEDTEVWQDLVQALCVTSRHEKGR